MEAPDISAFEGVPLVGADGTHRPIAKEPDLQEFHKRRANYEKWDRMAKICMLVFGCLYLVTFLYLVPDDGLIELEMANADADDDTTVWGGGEEGGPTEKRVEWRDEDLVIVAPTVNDEVSFQQYLNEKSNTFVAFYAPWCIWSQRMRPTWHEFAAVSQNSVGGTRGTLLQVLEVNCGQSPILCEKESVLAFPTMRWYRDGERFGHAEYRGDRTIKALLEYSEEMIFANATPDARSVIIDHYIYSESEDEDEDREYDHVDSESEDEDVKSFQVDTEWAGVPRQWLFATNLTRETFDEFITTNENAFVAFTTRELWCAGCQDMRPLWHQFALVANHAPLHVGVAEVDCMAQADLCRDLKIVAFPTLRWFHNSRPALYYDLVPRGTMTVNAFVHHSKAMLSLFSDHKEQVPDKLNNFIGNGGLTEEIEVEKDKPEPGQAQENFGSERQSTSTSLHEDEPEDGDDPDEDTSHEERQSTSTSLHEDEPVEDGDDPDDDTEYQSSDVVHYVRDSQV